MSAGSPRHSRTQVRGPSGCIIVTPQPATDPTILDSVAGFINEVATYNVPCDTKDQIQWARFEQLDCDAVLENVNGDKIIPSALILVLGYTTGIQVWAIPANGEAVELLAWRHGSVRVLRLLPTPYVVGRDIEPDAYGAKRPLMALCDSSTPGPHHCSLSFLSLKTGDQVKVIKFKNAILDVLANRRSVVVTFSERIAIFDAFTLEDRLTVTTCYLSPGIFPNPVALGARWMAYAEKNLISSKRSSGGNEGEGVQSYTATVLHAAKSLGKGLRELGETVASSLTGNPSFKPGTSPGNAQPIIGGVSDTLQKGVVTILDIENQATPNKALHTQGIIAHFTAHSEAIVYLAFDPSGLLLLTADKRGHDFHLFRIQPHPGGPALAAVHHLYILHRGDTTAKVQDMSFSPDSRWVSVSTLRGTTHVFPITPYGGNVGVRTHATPHVVNRMSRFHRSAGLPVEGRSNSPVSLFEAPVNSNIPYNNPRLPPYPHPTVIIALAQIRPHIFAPSVGNSQPRTHGGRPRLNSSSDDSIQMALRLCCSFAPPRAWFDNASQAHETSVTKQQAKPVESLFLMSCHGVLLQYDLEPHPHTSVPKEKVCDETPIELAVHAKAEWNLLRQSHFVDVPLPMSPHHLNLLPQDVSLYKSTKPSHTDDQWLSQVEIVTHAGPHRRLWMGPQFTFKTYTTSNGSPVSLHDAQVIEVGRSKPMNISTTYPILIESGSTSSCEQSPKLLETYQRLSEEVGGVGELQLKEDLADAMLESPGVKESGGRCVIVSMKPHTARVAKVVNPLGTVVTIHSDDDNEVQVPEEVVIHENCDEALFRPVVTPKPLLFAESKITNKIRASISETVRTKSVENNKVENGRKVKPKIESCAMETRETNRDEDERKIKLKTQSVENIKEENRSKIKLKVESPTKELNENKDENKIKDDNKLKAKPKIGSSGKIAVENNKDENGKKNKSKAESCGMVIKNEESKAKEPAKYIELKGKQNKSNKSDSSKYQNKSEIKIDLQTPKIDPKILEPTPIIKSEPIPQIVSIPIIEPSPKAKRSVAELSFNNDPYDTAEAETFMSKQDVAKCVVKKTEIVKNESTPNNVEKTLKSTEKDSKSNIKNSKRIVQIPDVFEESPKIIESTPKVTEAPKKSKSKSKILEVDKDSDSESNKKSIDPVRTPNTKLDEEPRPKWKPLITTPDLMDSADTFDFSYTTKTSKTKEKFESDEDTDFPLIFKSEDVMRDIFEDARDTEDILESFASFKLEKDTKASKCSKYQGLKLKPIEIVFPSEEEKGSAKKPRKPRTRLGIRLCSKEKDTAEKTEKDTENCSVEVTLPAPRRTWSSIVAPKVDLPLLEEKQRPILDLPDNDSEEDFNVEPPKKSYSTVAKQHLFEIDPHEDVCESGILLPEKIYKSTAASKRSEEFNSSKLSDDEKQDNGSSQTETTESDDSSKVVAMDTEEDSCQPEVTKSSQQGTEKIVKRKSKKKKR